MNAAQISLQRRGSTLVRTLTWLGWAILATGAIVGTIVSPQASRSDDQPVLTVTMSLLFGVLLVRLVVAAVIWRDRRTALIPLAIGIALWAAGSAVVSASGSTSIVRFPAPGETFYLLSYVGMAAFLVLDVGSRYGRASTAWLDAIIVCGGAGVFAGAILLTPFARLFPEGGVPLLVALLYPLIDLVLAIVVIAQWALSSRTWSRRTAGLLVGFVVLAIADSSLVLNLSAGTYGYSNMLAALWGVAFLLIAGAACMPRPPKVSLSRRLPGGFLIASAVVSIGVLLFRPAGAFGWALALPATITLIATGARLVVALRESRAATEAFHLAQTDDLTGLPNRRAVLKRLDEGIAGTEPLGLMLLDLDGFKDVNDTLGHSAGDTLLELVALRMRESLPNDVVLARIGGDEFAILVKTDDTLDLLEQAQAIRNTLMAPAKVDDMDLAMHASLGITVREPGDTRAADMLRRADIAMYEAKVSRAGAQIYDAHRDEFSRQRLRMGEELRRSLQKGHIIVWYQPKVNAANQLVSGMEALVRWDHPERGMIPPIAFLSVARRAGLMQQLSEVVTRRAIMDAVAWQRAGLNLNVAINLAPVELLNGLMLPVVYRELAEHGLPPAMLTIEVTEDTFLADPERARDVLSMVRKNGIKASIDDYGTGFSSLAYLRDLPVTELKMDRSFVSTVCADNRSRLIVSSTIDMAHALDLQVVAEGVENAAVTAEVVALGVDILQGYHVAAPMPGDQVDSWVRRWNDERVSSSTADPSGWHL